MAIMDSESLELARRVFSRPLLPIALVEDGIVRCGGDNCRRILGGDPKEANNAWWYCRNCKHGVYVAS